MTPLFNPRAERWSAHFQLSDALIVPLTAVGRATASLLRLNDSERMTIRANLLNRGRYTPPS